MLEGTASIPAAFTASGATLDVNWVCHLNLVTVVTPLASRLVSFLAPSRAVTVATTPWLKKSNGNARSGSVALHVDPVLASGTGGPPTSRVTRASSTSASSEIVAWT